jgi:hypothetical protein
MEKEEKNYIKSLEILNKQLEIDLREEKKKNKLLQEALKETSYLLKQNTNNNVKSCDDCSHLSECKSLKDAQQCDYFRRS